MALGRLHIWGHGGGQRYSVYETAALPLSYTGLMGDLGSIQRINESALERLFAKGSLNFSGET